MSFYNLESSRWFAAREKILSAKTPRWEQERLSKIEDEVAAMDISDLVAIGHFRNKQEIQRKIPPIGVKVWLRRCNIRSNWGEPEIAHRPTLAIGFPFLDLEPIFGAQVWSDSQIMYWMFPQKKNLPLHCIFDLLHRLEFHKYWGDDYLQVPVDWRLGNANCKKYAAKKLAEINEGRFKEIRPFYLLGDRDFTKWRHQFTPYDYEWQTKKYSRDKAYNHWEKIFKENA